jgi:restriction system protein
VRGGDNNELAAQVPLKHAVAIGWVPTLDLSSITDRDDLRKQMEEAYPGSGTNNAVGQLFRFATEIEPGDFVLTPEKATKKIHVCRCTGSYRFDPSVYGEAYPHIRPVEYLRSVDRNEFSVTVRNTLGSVLTVFRADAALPYLQSALGETPKLPGEEAKRSEVETSIEAGLWADEIEGQARGQILEALDEIEHHDFQVFVAGLMESLGYKARVGQRVKMEESMSLPFQTFSA